MGKRLFHFQVPAAHGLTENGFPVTGHQGGGAGQFSIIDVLLHPGFNSRQTFRTQTQFFRIGINFHAKCSIAHDSRRYCSRLSWA